LENKARYTLVGLFIIVFLSSLILFILWQAKYSFKDEQSYQYRVYTKTSIAGLNVDSFVEYKGLSIGTVKKIRIDPQNQEQIEIILNITHPTIIKEDSYATIQSQGITGNKNIEIDGGTISSKAVIPKEDSYKIIPLQQSFFDNLTASAQDMTQNINLTLLQINKLLSNKNIQNIQNTLTSLEDNSKSFNNTIEKLNTILDTNAPNTLSNIDTLTKEWTSLSIEIKDLLSKDIKTLLSKANSTMDSTANLEEIFSNIQNTIEKVDTTLDNINENGGDIIFKTRNIKYGPQEIRNEN